MGRIVYAAAMSHVLYPDYYGQNVGPHGRQMVEALITVVREMGQTLAAAASDALVVIADDHLNVFSFDAIPAFCVRVGRSVNRMVQDAAIEFDRALDGLPERYRVHEALANVLLETGMQSGFDFAASWSAPLDHASLAALTDKELHESGSHELLNWLVLLGAVSPAPARVRFFGEMGRIDLAALEWAVK